MDDGRLLLKAVMRSGVNDEAAVGAFVDYLQDNLPRPGCCFEVRYSFRIRYGGVRVERGSGAEVNPDWLFKVVVFHKKSYGRPTRLYTIHTSVNDPEMEAVFRKALVRLRS